MKIRKAIAGAALGLAALVPATYYSTSSVVSAFATSPNNSHPFWWGWANYQIVGAGNRVTNFHGMIFNDNPTDTLIVQVTVESPQGHYLWVPMSQALRPCSVPWNWSVNFGNRVMPVGPYTVIYWIYNETHPGSEILHWAWNVE